MVAAAAAADGGGVHDKSRPFGHCVTFIVAVSLLVRCCLALRKANAHKQQQATCFVWIALLSHQLRDAAKHGLWFWPLGSTPVLPYAVYLVLEQALPIVLSWWTTRWHRHEQQESKFEYDQLPTRQDADQRQDQLPNRRHEGERQLREMTVVMNV